MPVAPATAGTVQGTGEGKVEGGAGEGQGQVSLGRPHIRSAVRAQGGYGPVEREGIGGSEGGQERCSQGGGVKGRNCKIGDNDSGTLR